MTDFAADLFSEEQVRKELNELPDYERIEDVVTLAAGNYDPGVLELFAKLARVLGSSVSTAGYGTMRIVRELPLSHRRAYAISRLQDKAEKGELVPAFLEIEEEKEASRDLNDMKIT